MNTHPVIHFAVVALLSVFPLAADALSAEASSRANEIVFNRDIRPILSNTCFKCHGPDAKNNHSELRLDLRELALTTRRNKVGRDISPIVPGQPEASEVWRRITSQDTTKVMPPPDALHQLGERERALIKRWIEQGAPYQQHWSYLPPVRAVPPAVQHPERLSNPIDNFVQHQLASRGIEPAPPADRATLARRVSLDLTGLPLAREEVTRYIADTAPGAYERLVDRLIASPHFGERMAVPWLDVVRFADSVGFHGDQRQNIFPYRDYVIDAFNRNLPYDQFVREQLAGDLLPDPTPSQRVATGFNRLNLMTREGGAQPKEYLAKTAADRVRAVSTAFLGSTMGCAECHDHKYDPFTTRDFYRMAAYFGDVKQWGTYSGQSDTPELKGFTDDHPFPPEIEVDSPYLQRRLTRLQERDTRIRRKAVAAILASTTGREQALIWVRDNAAIFIDNPGGWLTAPVVDTPDGKRTYTEALPDHSIRLTGREAEGKPSRFGDPLTITLAPEPGTYPAVRLEVLPDPQRDGTVSRDESGAFNLTLKLARLPAGADEPEPLEVANVFPDRPTDNYINGYLAASLDQGWKSFPAHARESQSAVWQLARPLVLQSGDRLIAELATNNVRRVRCSVSPLGLRLRDAPIPATSFATLAAVGRLTAPDDLGPEDWQQLAAAYFAGTGEPDPKLYAMVVDNMREIAECHDGRAHSMVTVATDPLVTRVLPRGNWQDESGEIVTPAPPAFMATAAPATAARSTRLDLANWIVSADNPLTARTFVNRLWQQFFGTGLSAVTDDLGLQGEYPTHPELLDWLAVEFMSKGWDTKAVVRLIVTSATYRQSSTRRLELSTVDPANRLLASQTPRRLEAEFVRDNALFIAGLLDLNIGGPSANPYQPEGYYASLNFPKRTYETSLGERQYRRGLYTHWQRTFLHPMMANFDAPAREECTSRRNVSNTPLQALTLLNDPTFVEAARALAERVLQETGSPTARLSRAFELTLAREPSLREQDSLSSLLNNQLQTYRMAPGAAAELVAVGFHVADPTLDQIELAAWTQVARVLLNLNETIVRY